MKPTKKWPRHRNKKITVAAIVLGILLLGYGTFGLISWWVTTHSTAATATKKIRMIATHSSETPDETTPSPLVDYSVPADMPRSIALPSIRASGFIQRVSIDQHRAVATPGNIHVAGWYVHSARPGDKGLSIIDGHVQGRYEEGIFKRLGELKKGDTFQVEFGDLSKKNFTVRGTDSYAASEAAKYLFGSTADITHQLNLITCGGVYNKDTKQYNQRIIVIAELGP